MATPAEELALREELAANPIPSRELEIREMFATPQEKPEETSIRQRLMETGKPGGEEAIGTILTAVPAEILGGLAGLVSSPFVDSEQVEQNINTVREALTFVPRSPEGLKNLKRIADFLQPVTEKLTAAEEGLAEAAGGEKNPIAASLAKTIPSVAMTALGLGGVRRALGISKAVDIAKKLTTTGAKKLLKEAAPTIDGLKDAARGIYKELDDLNISVNPKSVTRLANELKGIVKRAGFNRVIHPKVNAVLNEFQNIRGTPQTLTQIDTLRRIANAAASGTDDEARIARLVIDKIDDTLDNLKSANFVNPQKTDIGAKFKDARQLWRRARKSELLEEAFSRAEISPSGFENGIRSEFRSIVNNKKKRKGFTEEEIQTMRQVVKGGTLENLAKLIGKFGISEGQSVSVFAPSLGAGIGFAVAGPAGAFAVPVIGQVSKVLAQKLTREAGRGANLLIKAGSDGKKVVQAYLQAVKRSERSPQELTELLLRPEISLKELKAKISSFPKEQRKLVADAVFLASFLQKQKQDNE